MAERELPSGTVTLLFTDIEGSTRLVQELGGRYAGALSEHRKTLRAAFAGHHGVEVDTQGDAFFYAFARASDAVSAARDGQERLAGGPVRVRMGVHTGEVELGDEGYVGVEVHRAARICGAAHGGQVLLSDATARLIDVDLHDLGAHRLKDLFAPTHLYQLGHADFPPLRTLNFTNLPVQSTPLVGRERELGESAALLREHRLVTLVGPGGTGKTRLGLQVAADAADDFPDGVFWVPLVALHDPDLVEPAIAQATGVATGLADHLAGKRVLFLLDNFEHLLGAAERIAFLLGVSDWVKFLVTSREPLRISGEWEYPVPSLTQDDAVALFVTRARALQPAFDPDPAVSEICRSIDGLPLAIELAAARIKVLSTEQILQRLGHRLTLLTSGLRDAPDRQRTLRATIDWSHQLLDVDEQALFARLAVFAGGWTLEAAEEVCGAGIDALEGLVSKQLVTHTKARFGMLETINEFAGERLDETGERAALTQRHSQYFLALAERVEHDVQRGDAAAFAERTDEDANLRLALDGFISTGNGALEMHLVASIWEFWFVRGRWEETRRMLMHALAADLRESAARAKVLRGAAWVAGRIGNADAARALGEDAIQAARQTGDDWLTARAIGTLAVIEDWRPDADRARVAALRDEAWRASKAAPDLEARWLNNAAIGAWRDGDFRKALQLGEQAVGRARQLGERRLLSAALPHLADAKRLLGELDSARADLAESLALGRELGFPEAIVESLHLLACVSAAAGDFGWTAALFGAGQREAGFGWIPEDPGHAREYEQALAAARHGLGDDQYEKVFAAGQAMSLDAVADYLQSDARALAEPIDTESALELIADQRQLRMSSFKVVGSYTRYDDSVRQTLVDAHQSIVMALAQPGHKRNAHLIWAAPGSGKTYFVQQVAASLPDTALAELNLAKSDAATLGTFLADMEAAGGRQLRFIDECDAKAGEAWPYELLLPALDAATAKGLAVVVVLAGSSGLSAEEMQQRMSSRPKGADLISRIPHTNVHTIQPLGIGDRMLVAVSQLRDAAAAAGRHISAVERMALYYAMVEPHVGSPRQVRELCVRAVERLLPGEERLRYDHLFSPGNPENKAFWMQSQPRHRALVGHFVEIED